MFDDKCTVIPDWVKDDLFGIRDVFSHSEKNDPRSKSHCHFEPWEWKKNQSLHL